MNILWIIGAIVVGIVGAAVLEWRYPSHVDPDKWSESGFGV